jgi:hypothetical protein
MASGKDRCRRWIKSILKMDKVFARMMRWMLGHSYLPYSFLSGRGWFMIGFRQGTRAEVMAETGLRGMSMA